MIVNVAAIKSKAISLNSKIEILSRIFRRVRVSSCLAVVSMANIMNERWHSSHQILVLYLPSIIMLLNCLKQCKNKKSTLFMFHSYRFFSQSTEHALWSLHFSNLLVCHYDSLQTLPNYHMD